MDEEKLFDESKFEFELPVWFVVAYRNPTVPADIRLADPNVGLLRTLNHKGEKCWALFTDGNLAERFVASEKLAGLHLVKISTADNFLTFLNEIEIGGYRWIVFDPEKGFRGPQYHSIAEVRDAVRRIRQT